MAYIPGNRSLFPLIPNKYLIRVNGVVDFDCLASYILSNYKIISTNLDKNRFAESLKNCQVFCLGESHISEKDRRNNAEFVHYVVWNGNTHLLYEDFVQIKNVQVKYKDLSEISHTWDISEKLTLVSLTIMRNIAVCCLTIKALKLLDKSNPTLFVFRFVNFISEFPGLLDVKIKKLALLFMNTFQTPINDKKPENILLATVYLLAIRHLLANSFLSSVQSRIHNLGRFFDHLMNPIEVKRDEALVNNTFDELKKQHHTIVLAGAEHLNADRPLVKELEKQNIPYIALTSFATGNLLKKHPLNPSLRPILRQWLLSLNKKTLSELIDGDKDLQADNLVDIASFVLEGEKDKYKPGKTDGP